MEAGKNFSRVLRREPDFKRDRGDAHPSVCGEDCPYASFGAIANVQCPASSSLHLNICCVYTLSYDDDSANTQACVVKFHQWVVAVADFSRIVCELNLCSAWNIVCGNGIIRIKYPLKDELYERNHLNFWPCFRGSVC